MNVKALVTGSNGFLGKHLIFRLKEIGVDVIPLERYLLSTQVSLKNFIKKNPIDYIFNLAGYGNHYNQQDEEEMLTANVINLFNLLEATKDIEYKALVNISTSSVLLPVQTFYSATKLSGELLVKAFASKYNKPVFSVRPSSVYGEGEADFRFIPKVIHSLLKDEEMEVVLDPKHDFIYIDDFLFGMIKFIDYADKLKGESVNVSTGKQVTNEQVIRILEKIHGSKLKIKVVKNLRSYDTKEWVVDNEVLKSLNWEPLVGLEEGLKRVYEYEKQRNT